MGQGGLDANRTMAVVGAGLIGRAWASIFARAGWRVRLYDPVDGQTARCRALATIVR